jgi:protein-disulfide isomerase
MKGRDYMIGSLAMLAGAGGAALALGAIAEKPAVNVADRGAIETIVREYILAHPEILPEAMANLQARELKKQVDANRKAIETPFAGAWEGAANGDVTLVQFFDYACTYCRASRPDVERLIAEDKNLRVVYREMPILGPDSEAATRASLAVAQQGNYTVYHHYIYSYPRATPQVIAAAVSAAKADPVTTRELGKSAAVEGELANNVQLWKSLQLSGTPSWIIGDQVINGALGYDGLKKAIAEARAKKAS